MSTTPKFTFEELNQRYLALEIARVRKALEHHIKHPGEKYQKAASDGTNAQDLLQIRNEMEFPPPLETLCAAFGLSAFERDVLLLCAGVELDSALASLLEKACGANRKSQPTFVLALAVLAEGHWSALPPLSPLRYWRLIEVSNTENLTTAALKIDECILHYLAGLSYFDERLKGYIKPLQLSEKPAPSHEAIVNQAVAAYAHGAKDTRLPVLQLYGNDSSSQYAVAAAICSASGANLESLNAQIIPHDPRELEALVRLCDRQAVLTQSILLLDCSGIESSDRTMEGFVSRFVDEVQSTLILAGRERRPLTERNSISFEISKPTAVEQLALWQQVLHRESIDGRITSLVSQFNLSAAAIKAVCDEAAGRKNGNSAENDFGLLLWDVCLIQTRRRMDELAQRINSKATWADLVLPEAPRQTLMEIAAQVRQRLKVYETWGFGARISRGLGITALLVGPSGTGKTMAAEVLANELHLDLYRIDLSQVVSKYIGETEKNLRRVFDAAEDGGAILLFDEADAIFGKRSEVKDSHDRYANIEVSYLLQRMEDYRGLAILTTNNKEAIDTAFMRRIRFLIQLPFPGVEQRKEIWRRIFPPATPTAGLDIDKLARLNVSGGNIKNIALYAAFLAAEAGEPVRMSHLLRAARVEYSKLEMSLTDSEIRGWV